MRQFSPPHLAALTVAAATSVVSIRAARRKDIQTYAYLLALVILAAWVGEYVADGINGTYSARYTLPLQLTDAVSAVAIVALLTRRQIAVELLYFWSLSASLQALLTPDLGQNFPSVYYFTYFGYHVGALVAALMLTFGLALYPRPHAALKAFACTLIWTAIAAVGDLITGGNYMYLRAKPIHNSLLNLMGPWPWYIVATAALGLAMLLVLQLIADTVRDRDRQAATPRGLRADAETPHDPSTGIGRSSARSDERLQRYPMK